jgi:hypothetical protein
MEAPDDNVWLVRKAITIVAMHGLLRKNEIVKMSFDDVKVYNGDGVSTKYYEFRAHRGKARGPKKTMGDSFQVTEPICVRLLDLYIACFLQVSSYLFISIYLYMYMLLLINFYIFTLTERPKW